MGGDKTWHCTSLLANDMPVYLLSKSTTASSTQSKSIRTLSSFDKLCLPANIQIADTIPNNLQHLPSLVGWMVSHSHFQISTLSVSLDTHGVLVDHRMQYPASKLWEFIQSVFNWLCLLLLYVCYSQDIVSDKKDICLPKRKETSLTTLPSFSETKLWFVKQAMKYQVYSSVSTLLVGKWSLW